MEYMRYLQEACMIISLENYAYKFVEKETVKKHYFVDNGLLHLFLNDPETSLLENLCAITLFKKYNSGLYFYNRHIEVDFYVPDESLAVQVAFSLKDDDTHKREVAALVALNGVCPLKRAMIITYDEDGTIDGNAFTIEVVPIWMWLLCKEI